MSNNTPTTETPLQTIMEDCITKAYNLAITHAIETVSNNYIAGHSVVTPVLGNIIETLKKLKK